MVFYEKGVLENFAKFTGKHLWLAKFLKTPLLQNTSGRLLLAFLCNVCKIGKIHRKTLCLRLLFLKKATLTQVFSCKFCEIFKNTFFTEDVRVTASESTITLC